MARHALQPWNVYRAGVKCGLFDQGFRKSRSLAEFILSPFTPFRAVRKWRANGLGMTGWEISSNFDGGKRTWQARRF
jgi:hypothetical protein